MKKLEPLKLWFIAIVLIAFFGARPIVSNAQNEDADVSAPLVTNTIPDDGANGVTLNQAIAVTFSQAMSAPSMDRA